MLIPLPHMEKMPEGRWVFFRFLVIETNVPEGTLFHNEVLKDFFNYATITNISFLALMGVCHFLPLKI